MGPLLDSPPMESEHLEALLSVAGTESEDEWTVLKDDRTLTLHSAESGVGLNVGKVRKVRVDGKLLFAQNATGDVYVLKLSSVFAGLVDPPSKTARTAGFR